MSQVVVVVTRLLAGFTVLKDLLTGLCACPARTVHIQASVYAGGSLSGAALNLAGKPWRFAPRIHGFAQAEGADVSCGGLPFGVQR